MTILLHLLQYQLHLSELTDNDTTNDEQYQLPMTLLTNNFQCLFTHLCNTTASSNQYVVCTRCAQY